jgi:hypothetical protein
MFRFTNLAILGLGSLLAANAGQIRIGSGPNGANGLTGSYINSDVIVGNTGAGGYTLQNQTYDTVLFSGATESSVAPTPYAGYGTTSGGSLTDPMNHVTFAMINDGNAADNFWGGTQTGASPTITVPIGLLGVTDVWTMINTELAEASSASPVSNFKDVTVDFYFGTSANEALASDDKVAVKLINGPTSGLTQYGETRDAVACGSSCGSPALANGPTLVGPTSVAINATQSVAVVTGNVFSGAYNNALAAYGNSSSGNVVLYVQGFFFNGLALTGAFAGDTNLNTYLVAVQVMEVGSNGTSTALSAITVDTAAGSTSTTPEPATVFLFLTGLGAIGLARFRRS